MLAFQGGFPETSKSRGDKKNRGQVPFRMGFPSDHELIGDQWSLEHVHYSLHLHHPINTWTFTILLTSLGFLMPARRCLKNRGTSKPWVSILKQWDLDDLEHSHIHIHYLHDCQGTVASATHAEEPASLEERPAPNNKRATIRKGRLDAKPVPTSAMAHKVMPPTIKTSRTSTKLLPLCIVDHSR